MAELLNAQNDSRLGPYPRMLFCCAPACCADAEWQLYPNDATKGDSDYTLACTAHVGALLTDATCTLVYPIAVDG